MKIGKGIQLERLDPLERLERLEPSKAVELLELSAANLTLNF
jgi:hypothetical protein